MDSFSTLERDIRVAYHQIFWISLEKLPEDGQLRLPEPEYKYHVIESTVWFPFPVCSMSPHGDKSSDECLKLLNYESFNFMKIKMLKSNYENLLN